MIKYNKHKIRTQKITVSVIGGHDSESKVEHLAHNIGYIIAKMGCILVCGGLGGVMMHASKGAKEAGGLTIGLLPGKDKNDANPFIDIALPTSIGYARNAIVACSADIIVALPGSHGTNSEICYGLVWGRPVIDLGGWGIKGMIKVKDIHQAQKAIKACIRKIQMQRA
ncbi:MAG: TIGR00725 family protein [Candidatus Omnitrophota bacterium]|nr:TIGR00725 family protein [Candidatus Omnitrophota bacterium]MDZ4241687.1 TIGR00725 family protein [Candidatus Omnitrophota bacterium]